jgi:hypothetical protein
MDNRLLDKQGRLVAYIKTGSDKDEIRTSNGALKGYYFKKFNQTRDIKGNLIGYGNLLTTLI